MASPNLPVQLVSGSSSDQPATSEGVKHLVDMNPGIQVIPSAYVLPFDILSQPVSNSSTSTIPVIDMHGLEDGPSSQRALIVQAICSASADWGFFRVVNHGIKASLMEEMVRAVEGFFELPLAEKLTYASDDVMSPSRFGTSLNTSKQHALHWRDFLRHFGRPVHKTLHLWPNNPVNYREVAKEYLQEVWGLVMKLAGAISEGLGLEKGHVAGIFGEGFQILAANYYPPCPQPNLTLGLAAHSDHGGLTILMENDVDGLQVRHEGKWVPIPHVPGTLLVNIGDYLEILSNGRYRSVEHRAVVNGLKTRISIAVGNGPGLETTVAPARQLMGPYGEGPKYRPVLYKDYMRSQQTSVSRGKSALKEVSVDSSVGSLPLANTTTI